MDNWASRRKLVYASSLLLVLVVISFAIFWKFWYRAPNCFDGLANGDEVGVDCGGSCQLICPAEIIKPALRFDPRLFKVSEGLYSVLVFVENYNIDSFAPYVPYKFEIYDKEGKIIYTRDGVTALPVNETAAIFEGSIVIKDAEPKKVSFDLDPNIKWQKKSGTRPEIKVTNSPLLRQESSPRIEARAENRSVDTVKNLELIAVVFDGKDNPIAASRTFVDTLKKGDKADVFFTWPKPFDLGVKICEKPSDVVLAIDRSGSMASLGKSPPEPLTSVKKAASTFISLLKGNDSAGLVSFATEAELVSAPTKNFSELKSLAEKISIKEGDVQYTNIADAVAKSFESLFSTTTPFTDGQKIIVLLTDGVATRPVDLGLAKTEEQEIAYAEGAAKLSADRAKQEGTIIYTIGLGGDIHQEFLQKIASTPEGYFQAPSTTTLESVYKKISSSICKELPARIEVKYKILGPL